MTTTLSGREYRIVLIGNGSTDPERRAVSRGRLPPDVTDPLGGTFGLVTRDEAEALSPADQDGVMRLGRLLGVADVVGWQALTDGVNHVALGLPE